MHSLYIFVLVLFLFLLRHIFTTYVTFVTLMLEINIVIILIHQLASFNPLHAWFHVSIVCEDIVKDNQLKYDQVMISFLINAFQFNICPLFFIWIHSYLSHLNNYYRLHDLSLFRKYL